MYYSGRIGVNTILNGSVLYVMDHLDQCNGIPNDFCAIFDAFRHSIQLHSLTRFGSQPDMRHPRVEYSIFCQATSYSFDKNYFLKKVKYSILGNLYKKTTYGSTKIHNIRVDVL